MDDRAFEGILDDCLERLVKGETLEQCLDRYPGEEARLEPLLRTAQAARAALDIQPRSDFKARARYEFRAALETELAPKKAFRFSLMPRWATALMVISVLLFAGGGTVVVASGSMPDSRLYPLKMATEKVQLAMTISDMIKARLCADQADKRVVEIVYLASKGDARQLEVVTENLNERLALLTILVLPEAGNGAPEAFTAAEPVVEPAEEAMLVPSPSEPSPSLAPPPEEAPPPPEPSPQPAPDDRAAEEGDDEPPSKNGNRAELKEVVASNAVDHASDLHRALVNSPDAVKQGLRRAISVSEAGYRKALEALD